jgi:hypothetical protein
MILTKSSRAAVFSTFVVVSVTAAAAQTTPADPHHPGTAVAQTPPSGTMSQGPGAQPGQPGMMGRGMMGMHGHMMKVMFAIVDTNGDGALSFEEITAAHKRIFDKVDANKDGKVTPEEAQAFARE